MKLEVGAKLRSAVCDTQVVVVRCPEGELDLGCGGAPLLPEGGEGPEAELNPELAEGTQIGKRYADEEAGVELLCTRPGDGSLTLDGEVLPLKGAKPLPASD